MEALAHLPLEAADEPVHGRHVPADVLPRPQVQLLRGQPDRGAGAAGLQRSHEPGQGGPAVVPHVQEVEDLLQPDPGPVHHAHAPGWPHGWRFRRLRRLQEPQLAQRAAKGLEVQGLGSGFRRHRKGLPHVAVALAAGGPEVLEGAGGRKLPHALHELRHRELAVVVPVDEVEEHPRLRLLQVQGPQERLELLQRELRLGVDVVCGALIECPREGRLDAPEAPPDLQAQLLQQQRWFGEADDAEELPARDAARAVHIHLLEGLPRLHIAETKGAHGLDHELLAADAVATVHVEVEEGLLEVATVLLEEPVSDVLQEQCRRHRCDGAGKLAHRRSPLGIAADDVEERQVLARVNHVDAAEQAAELLERQALGAPRPVLIHPPDRLAHRREAGGEPPSPEVLERPHRCPALHADDKLVGRHHAQAPEV
mmetsp:Transcript_3666/g.11505  ORF Transcript_3666/g.11505 Transcript_3666/m.11505 type:complete len:426 (-) Transcript_3666:488-1765(-)